MDTSTVFHISILDADIANDHNPAEPWIFETEEGQTSFPTEDEACSMQRNYRRARGFDPLSGERLFQRC
jgi:hypothetical protein